MLPQARFKIRAKHPYRRKQIGATRECAAPAVYHRSRFDFAHNSIAAAHAAYAIVFRGKSPFLWYTISDGGRARASGLCVRRRRVERKCIGYEHDRA
jgi:hypothetical protein